MNVEETRNVWFGMFQHLQQFVEDILNLSNGVWDGPGDSKGKRLI
jgi:hypothetical protein